MGKIDQGKKILYLLRSSVIGERVERASPLPCHIEARNL